jgi:hypothetical protein
MNNENQSTSVKGFWWPEIDDVDSAKRAAAKGTAAAILCAGITLLVIMLNQTDVLKNLDINLNIDSSAILDVFLFAGIAFGISKYSRFAAVSGLVLYLLERFYAITQTGNSGGMVMTILLILFFINGVRGCYAYHQFGEDGGGSPRPAMQPVNNPNNRYQIMQNREVAPDYDLRPLGNPDAASKPVSPAVTPDLSRRKIE